jgi:hypothetical protein
MVRVVEFHVLVKRNRSCSDHSRWYSVWEGVHEEWARRILRIIIHYSIINYIMQIKIAHIIVPTQLFLDEALRVYPIVTSQRETKGTFKVGVDTITVCQLDIYVHAMIHTILS